MLNFHLTNTNSRQSSNNLETVRAELVEACSRILRDA